MKKRLSLWLLAAATLLLGGCTTPLKAVRGFADETKKISVAFDPLLAGTVTQCQEREKYTQLYASTTAVRDFDPAAIAAQATANCKPIADENETARGISGALASYADKLSALAGDGVASSVDDDYDTLAKKIGEFKDFPADRATAAAALLKFITHAVIAREQQREVADALSHEEAVGLLADALVLYSERVYGGYITFRTQDNDRFKDYIRSGSIPMPPLLARLQLIQLTNDQAQLAQQRQMIAALRSAVTQMKLTLKDLRANLGNLTAEQRLKEVDRLAKEVRSLYKQLDKAF